MQRRELYHNLLAAFAILMILTACKKNKSEQTPEFDPCRPDKLKLKNGLFKATATDYEYQSPGGAVAFIAGASGNGLVVTLGYQEYCNFTYQLWGDGEDGTLGPASHENLNGKHLKDKLGTNRSIIFPDGTKITLVATAPWYMGAVTTISIYEGRRAYRINLSTNKIEYDATNETAAKNMDEAEADGETSSFEITATGLNFFNIYNEDTPGNKTMQKVNLGSIYKDSRTRVDDLYDDTRLDHT